MSPKKRSYNPKIIVENKLALHLGNAADKLTRNKEILFFVQDEIYNEGTRCVFNHFIYF